ncbi:3-phosphoshikimate 1-carboxyvinyltransferase [Desulfonema magnum]|uniref:3-phosphoshikimate 1-carboxyvinyltransferase n=1 Tax=Desulfonema magnum TaxID=45655 RepID=A0A975GMU4_9BACT|nr:3-phosphoshikimate 1-carboxyvinyltransferase [Desulfonema magnum]QTA87087.1 3-phosphoshikimate 1-carboxyvinyltransferase [Desulfonema magnum]
MLEIKPRNIANAQITVPGSKSYTHRILIASGLSDGLCTIENALKSEDTLLTLGALKHLGVKTDVNDNNITIHGTKGILSPCDTPVYLGNSGTSVRLLTAVAALGKGTYTLTGTERMAERPIQDLLDALRQMGVSACSVNNNGCPPLEITGGEIKGGKVGLKCKISSQYLSALLLIAPYTREGLEITVTEGPVSKPYIDMTVDVMKQLNVELARDGYNFFNIPGKQVYKAGSYLVESDCSNAGYFWAAAAVTGGTVKVRGISRDSRQGDVRLTEVFETMGCKVVQEKDGLVVSGGKLSATEVDMADMPDMVPTLAVVAAFAEGTTVIKNVAHLKAKESDRLTSVATELSKMGIQATCTDTGLIIRGGNPHGAEIDTYNDHRIAMCFAVAGLSVPGVFIRDEKCVEKSFPNFWEVFEELKN